jgi:hypothetical protein
MKGIIVIFLLLLAGIASAYTPEQQTMLDGMNLSFRLGMAYEMASQGQNVAGYNALVDEYNAWIRQHFGEDISLLMPKLNEPPIAITPLAIGGTQPLTRPFNASSDLSQFGKQQVYAAPGFTDTRPTAEDISQQELQKFLAT